RDPGQELQARDAGRGDPPGPGGADPLGHERLERGRLGGPADDHVPGRDHDPRTLALHGRRGEGVAEERPAGVVGLHGAAVTVPHHIVVVPSIWTSGRVLRNPAMASVVEIHPPSWSPRARQTSPSVAPKSDPPRFQTSRIGKVVPGVREKPPPGPRGGGRPRASPPTSGRRWPPRHPGRWSRRCRRWSWTTAAD